MSNKINYMERYRCQQIMCFSENMNRGQLVYEDVIYSVHS